MKRHFTFGGVLALVVLALAANSSRADVWTETGFPPGAGQTLPTAQNINQNPGAPLTSITGTINPGGDIDLYRFGVSVASTFSATTVNAITNASGMDTELFLFDSSGHAVYANDDDSSGTTLRSTLPPGSLFGPLAPGIYYLAIATAGNEPVSVANQLLFSPDSPSTTIRSANPSAPGATLFGWDASLADPGTGVYEIDLTSAVTVPEPATYLAGTLAVLGVFVFSIRRRRSTPVAP